MHFTGVSQTPVKASTTSRFHASFQDALKSYLKRRKTFPLIRLPPSRNLANRLPPSLLSFKIKFKNPINLALAMRD